MASEKKPPEQIASRELREMSADQRLHSPDCGPTGEALISAMQLSPHGDVDIAPQGMPMRVRNVVL